MTWRKKKSWCSRGTEGEQLGFVFCSPGPELLANSAKATGGEDVTCRSSVCVDVTSSPSPRSPRGKTPAGQTLLDNSSVGNTHFPWIAGAEKEGRAAEACRGGVAWQRFGGLFALCCLSLNEVGVFFCESGAMALSEAGTDDLSALRFREYLESNNLVGKKSCEWDLLSKYCCYKHAVKLNGDRVFA